MALGNIDFANMMRLRLPDVERRTLDVLRVTMCAQGLVDLRCAIFEDVDDEEVREVYWEEISESEDENDWDAEDDGYRREEIAEEEGDSDLTSYTLVSRKEPLDADSSVGVPGLR
ncbi:hypothetical protein HDZ31DRAFT_67258 [Schizophyllum fasciatum]